jgi:hypothetical protein
MPTETPFDVSRDTTLEQLTELFARQRQAYAADPMPALEERL